MGAILLEYCLTNNNSSPDDPRNNLVQYFEFKQGDCRYDNVQSMLSTLMVEIYHKYVYTGLRKINEHSSILDFEGQFGVLQEILWTAKCPETVWILANFSEHLPRYKWLLDKLGILTANSEIRFKVLFVNEKGVPGPSSNKVDIQMTDLPTDASNARRDSLKDVDNPDLFDSIPMELMVKNPQLWKVRTKVNDLLEESSPDPELHKMLVTLLSLNIDTTLSSLEQCLLGNSRLETTVFSCILRSMAQDLQEESIIEILQLVTFSFRPLTTRELLDLEMTRRSWSQTRIPYALQADAIPSWLPGIIAVRRNEVCLGHRRLRDFILSAVESPIRQRFGENQQRAHSQIACLCLRYILSSRGRSLLERYRCSEREQVSGPESRLDFLLYAVRFWPVHARRAGTEFPLGSTSLQMFLKDSELLMRWAGVYSIFSHTFIQLGLQHSGAFAIFAEHGLETMLIEVMENSTNAPWYKEECSTALIAAAANEQSSVVSLLLDRMDHDKNCLERALLAALPFGNRKILDPLLKRILKTAERLSEVSDSLHRVAILGQTEIMRRLYKGWTCPDDNDPDLGKKLLQTASAAGSMDIVKYIFDQEENNLQKHDLFECTSLSSKHAHCDVTAFLMEKALLRLCCDGWKEAEKNKDEKEIQHDHSRMVQKVLKDAIEAGQDRSLRSLMKALEVQGQHLESVEDLLCHAVDYGRAACFKLLVEAYTQKINIASMRTKVLEKGNGSMFRTLMSVKNDLDDSTFPPVMKLAQSREEYTFDLFEILVAEGQKTVSKEVYFEQITNLLGFAVDKNKPNLAKLLIKAGADLEKTSCEETRTPLFQAAYRGYEEIAASLLEAKADPEAADSLKGWKPIHAAADNANILRTLLQTNLKVDVNARTAGGSTAVMLAVLWNKEDCVKVLLEHQPDLHCTAKNRSLLSTVSIESREASPKLAFMLLDAGMDPCHKEVMEINKLQLHECVKYNQVELLQRLLLYNFLIDQKNEDGKTPLNCIRPESDIAILRLLVHRGATVNTVDNRQETPLSMVVRSNDVQKAEFLVSKEANPNARLGYHEGTPLHRACRWGSLEMIKMLIGKGADSDDIHGGVMGTIFQAACRRDDTNNEKSAVLNYLLNIKRADENQSSRHWGNNLSTACLMADMEIVKALVNRGVDVKGEDGLRRRPIHFALYRTLERVKYLREKGADLSVKDVMDRNALHFAVVSGRLDIVKYVINEKPELVNEGDCDGWTPLFWAVRKCLMWDTETAERGAIIKKLKSHGAKIMIQGEGVDKRWTPYELARYYSLDVEIVKELTPNLNEQTAEWKRILRRNFRKPRPSKGGFCGVCLMVSKSVAWLYIPWLNLE